MWAVISLVLCNENMKFKQSVMQACGWTNVANNSYDEDCGMQFCHASVKVLRFWEITACIHDNLHVQDFFLCISVYIFSVLQKVQLNLIIWYIAQVLLEVNLFYIYKTNTVNQ